MAEHSFIEGVCRYCGAMFVAGEDQRTCLNAAERAAVPRATPPSIFESTEGRDAIHARIQELKAERDAALAATTTVE